MSKEKKGVPLPPIDRQAVIDRWNRWHAENEARAKRPKRVYIQSVAKTPVAVNKKMKRK